MAEKLKEIVFEIDKSDSNRDWIRSLAKKREKKAEEKRLRDLRRKTRRAR